MDKLTTKSQEAIASAMRAAATAGNPQLEPVHVLVALLEQPGGVAPTLVDAVGANRAAIVERAQAEVATLPGASGSSVTQPSPSRPMMTVITQAGEEASGLGDEYRSEEHTSELQSRGHLLCR